jgi:hypothetical protein
VAHSRTLATGLKNASKKFGMIFLVMGGVPSLSGLLLALFSWPLFLRSAVPNRGKVDERTSGTDIALHGIGTAFIEQILGSRLILCLRCVFSGLCVGGISVGPSDYRCVASLLGQ